MWVHIHLYITVWTLGSTLYYTASMPIDCASQVSRCPSSEKKWLHNSKLFKCTLGEGYVCMRDSKGYLYESCTHNFTVKANTGNCPVLYGCINGRPYLGTIGTYFSCPENVTGCPPQKHEQYSIYQLLKYPRCIVSNLSEEVDITSPSTTLLRKISTNKPREKEIQPGIAIAVTLVITIPVIGAVYICYNKRRKIHRDREYYAVLRIGQATDNLQHSLLIWNEIQTDRVQVFPNVSAKLDAIYTEVLINDESKQSYNKLVDGDNVENIKLDEIFTVQHDKPARFIFMLGEAGYGKTVICQRITKSWCQAWKNENHEDDLLKRLKEFNFLFFVKMRDAPENQTSLIEIIKEVYSQFHPSRECLMDTETILKEGQYRSLIILDGLDEWNLSNEQKKHLIDSGIPNCRHMPNSTILITMRSWQFMEVKAIQLRDLDRLVRIRGLDEKGIETFSEKIICNFLKIDKRSDYFLYKTQRIKALMSSSSHSIVSLMKIPLLAFFSILTLNENVACGNSLTTFCISILETLMKRSLQNDQYENHIKDDESDSVFKEYWHVRNHIKELSSLGKIALSGLTSHDKTLTFRKEKLHEIFGELELKKFLKIGILIKTHKGGKIHEDNIGISFIHKVMQEFLSAIYLWREGNTIERFLHEEVHEVERALEFSMVLIFLSGLSPATGCEISRAIIDSTSRDKDIRRFRYFFSAESYEKVFHLYDLQLSCYREVRRQKSIKTFHSEGKYKFSLSDIIIHGRDTDTLAIRETADVLLYHRNDIKSLQMKFVPDDRQRGITNEDLKHFLDNSESIESLNIEGYVDGQCRIFGDLGNKMSKLRTIGLHHIAIPDEILRNLFTKSTETKFEAVGLFNIRHPDDSKIPYEYTFSLDRRIPSHRSGFERKQSKISACETLSSINKMDSGRPILKEILKILPTFKTIATFHSSYMESEDDRKELLQVLPKITNLVNIGYHGSSIFKEPDDEYDSEILEVIMNLKQLKRIFLCNIIWKKTNAKLSEMFELKEISLQDVEMNKNDWSIFVASVVHLSEHVGEPYGREMKIILTGTNIDHENRREMEGTLYVKLTIKDES